MGSPKREEIEELARVIDPAIWAKLDGILHKHKDRAYNEAFDHADSLLKQPARLYIGHYDTTKHLVPTIIAAMHILTDYDIEKKATQ